MDEKERLKTEFSRLRDRVKLGGRILLLGLGAEIVVLLIFAQGKPWLETTSLILSAVAVIAGVWIEEAAGSKAEDVSDELQRLSDEDVARSMERAAEANQRAEEARLALEKFRAHRQLSQEQLASISERLKPFAGTRYDVDLSSHEYEIVHFALQIAIMLSMADWPASNWAGLRRVLSLPGDFLTVGVGVTVENVVVALIAGKSPPKLSEPAQALAAALKEAGFEARFSELHDSPGMSTNKAAIHILIGRKS